jgi:hypothetical protein
VPDTASAREPSRPALHELTVAGEAGSWEGVGFAVEGDSFRVGSVTVRLGSETGSGLVGWTLSGLRSTDLDGLPTRAADAPAPADTRAHPNGALSIDHVVVSTPKLERTLAALAAAGLELRRERLADTPQGPVRQAFYRVGEAILEVVAPPDAPDGPAAFWGVVFTVGDVDACAALLGDRLGRARDAVQPGRRIATVRREAGLGLPVALMTPEPSRP